MREILFKAKRFDNGEWIHGCLLITNKNNYYIAPTRLASEGDLKMSGKLPPNLITYEVFKETISQFTGLLDKNGNKIFENDIIKFENGAEYEIIFEDYMFKISNETHKEALFESEFDDIEIIGNKFEEVRDE